MRIELEGHWDEQEIRAGLRAARPVPVWVYLVACLAIVAAAVLLDSGGRIGSAEALGLLVVAATMAVALLIVVPRQIHKAVNIPSFTGPVSGVITDEAMVVTTSDTSSTTPWSVFRSMQCNDSAAALLTRQRTHLLVLRNWFPDQAAWDEFTGSVPALIKRSSHHVPTDRTAAITDGPASGVDPTEPRSGVRFGGPFHPTEHRRVMARMSPARRLGIAFAALGTTLSAVTLAAGDGSAGPGFLPLGLVAIALGAAIVFGLPALATRRARQGVTGAGLTGTADESGIALRYESGRSDVGWSSFVDIVTDDHGVGLMLNNRAGFVIVRSWFDSDAEWQRFLALAAEHIQRQ